jgi:hypothetical protein
MRLFSASCWARCLGVSCVTLSVCGMLTSVQCSAQAQEKERPVEHPTSYRSIQIDGLSIFYREAGPKDKPTLFLLHGLPSSSPLWERRATKHCDVTGRGASKVLRISYAI